MVEKSLVDVDAGRWSSVPKSKMRDRETIAVAARVVIRQHGEDAIDHAKRMAWRYTKAGDDITASEWLQIERMIREIEAATGKNRLPSSNIDEQAKPAA